MCFVYPIYQRMFLGFRNQLCLGSKELGEKAVPMRIEPQPNVRG
jgi:hypothetical protein